MFHRLKYKINTNTTVISIAPPKSDRWCITEVS